MASSEEVAEARERVASKRDKVRKAGYEEQARAVEVSNDLTLAQLKAQEARLDAQLETAGANKSEIKDASSEAFDTAKEQEKAAKAAASARDKE